MGATVKIVHLGLRKWRRARNHMDARHCPDCGATVHGNYGQMEHETWHLELAELLNSLSERIGDEAEPEPETPWTAAVDGEPIQLEATE